MSSDSAAVAAPAPTVDAPMAVPAAPKPSIVLQPVVYDDTDKTDFKKMVVDVVNTGNSIFLFNDNYVDRTSESMGANTAAIRPLAFTDPIRAVGIPTGWSAQSGGFKTLSQDVQKAITCAFERLNTVLTEQPDCTTIYYSADAADPESFGYKLFAPCDEVKKYLKKKLAGVVKRFDENAPIKFSKIEATEHRLEDVAIRDMISNMPASKKQKRRKADADDDSDDSIMKKVKAESLMDA